MEYLEEVQLSLEQLGDGDLDALRGIRVPPAALAHSARHRRPRIVLRHAAGHTPSRAHAPTHAPTATIARSGPQS